MKARMVWILPAVLCLVVLCLAPSLSQNGAGIEVRDAQVVRELSMRMDERLPGRLAGVSERIGIYCASLVHWDPMVPIPPQFQSDLAKVRERICMVGAGQVRVEALTYPRGAIKDVTPPTISGLEVTLTGPDSASITWTTNELADSRVIYRGEPGVPSQAVENPLYTLEHKITLSGLQTRTTYYFKVLSTDRSGNTATTPEQTFYVASAVEGDVNDDGVLNMMDVTLALRLCIGADAPGVKNPRAADLDGDGKVSIGEVVRLLYRAVGLAPS